MAQQRNRRAKPGNSRESSKTRGYPRPQLERENWGSLDGPWEFAIDKDASQPDAQAVRFDQTIQVPFAPESPASGVNNTSFFNAVWYRREFAHPSLANEQRLILHFGAVDYLAKVWVNDSLVCTHEGGYTPFSIDITDALSGSGAQT